MASPKKAAKKSSSSKPAAVDDETIIAQATSLHDVLTRQLKATKVLLEALSPDHAAERSGAPAAHEHLASALQEERVLPAAPHAEEAGGDDEGGDDEGGDDEGGDDGKPADEGKAHE